MLSSTDIANQALARLGVTLTVSDLTTDNSAQAKVLRRLFQSSLDTVASDYAWRFLSRYQALAVHSEDPAPMYVYGYFSPSDSLQTRSIARDGIFPLCEELDNEKNIFEELVLSTGNTIIMTNVENAWARYTLRTNIASLFPVYFARAVSGQLSLDAAPQLITNNFAKVASTLNTQAQKDMTNAIANDLSRAPRKRESESTFVKARW